MTAVEARNSLRGRTLYLCTPDREDLGAFVRACIRGGVDIVQLRDKMLEARPLIARARILREICGEEGVPFIINDRPDLALEVGADGVHLGQDDAPVSLARQLLGPEAIIGLSTHSDKDLAGARNEPLDYLSAGPVVETPTKPGRVGTGVAYLGRATQAARQLGIGCFVTGGVTPDTVPDLARAGARGFVVVRYLTEAANPLVAAKRLVDAIAKALALEESTAKEIPTSSTVSPLREVPQ